MPKPEKVALKSAVMPEPSAITGREPADGSGPVAALTDFYRAFNGRDLAAMRANWAELDEIAMDNPLGGIKRGWAEIGSVYQRLFEGPARVYVEFYDYTLQATPDMFYAVGRERGWFERDGERLTLAIRTSRVFRRTQGVWRQVHHHGSIDDPELLARYQRAVRATRTAFLSTCKEVVMQADTELDCRGLNCPLPILKTKKALSDVSAGATLKVISTDPGSVKDFQAFAKQTGNELLESTEANGEYRFLIRKH